jgi:hypothetical protein
MSISAQYYGSVDEANDYFQNRLFADAWTNANAADYPKALIRATQIMDALNYKGVKNTVWQLMQNFPCGEEFTAWLYWPQGERGPTPDQVRAAESAQELEFPRGSDTEVPEAIRRACYEIAFSLLDGKDPELELENLSVSSQGYSSVRTTYNRNQVPLEHIINGVPSAEAWRLLRPFLRDGDHIKLSRKS